MQISERTINTALNQLADTYEHGPPIYCFHKTDYGDPDRGDQACVLGHLVYTLLQGKLTRKKHPLDEVAEALGHGAVGRNDPDAAFYGCIRKDNSGRGLASMSQAEVAVALRKYAQAYHPVPDKVALVIVKPQALAA